MSSRQLRKLRKQQELNQQDQVESEYAPLSEDDEPVLRKPRANVFSGFASLGDDGDGNNNNEDDDDEAGAQQETPARSSDEPVHHASKKSKKKSKKKKKAKKAESEPSINPAGKNDMDEIDRALEQLKVDREAAAGTTQPNSTNQYSQELARLLSINTTHLKVLNEMRSLFGREIITAASSDSDPQAMPDARRMRQEGLSLEQYLKGRPGQSISEVLLRRNPFVQGKEHWPKASAGGLTMKQLKDGDDLDGSTEFAFAHDKTYDALEAVFFHCVQTHDPMMLVHFLHSNPYHVSSLIQVSKVAKQDQNAALAGDLCERALFTFGRVTLSAFRERLQEGRARLSFRRPENRQFWLAGYNYVRNLMNKGTFRTALEWAKLLLSLSPADEYGMLNVIHALAIRAREARWFLKLVCENDLFSYLMARHVPNRDYIRQTAVLARLQVGDRDGATTQLKEGLQNLPWLYCSLFSALNIDVPKSVWGIQPRNQSEELYTALYISQAKDLWNNSQASTLLTEVAATTPRPPAYETLPEAEDVRESTARFVYLDNAPALMALVPHALLHASPNFDFDPLPPPAEENIFSSVAQRLPWEGMPRGDPVALQLEDMVARLRPAEQRRWEQLFEGPLQGQDGQQRLGELLPGVLPEDAEALAELQAQVSESGEEVGGGVLARLAQFIFGAGRHGGGGAGGDDREDAVARDNNDTPYGADWTVADDMWSGSSPDEEDDGGRRNSPPTRE